MTKLLITFITMIRWQAHHHLAMLAEGRKWQRLGEAIRYLIIRSNLDKFRHACITQVSEMINPHVDVF